MRAAGPVRTAKAFSIVVDVRALDRPYGVAVWIRLTNRDVWTPRGEPKVCAYFAKGRRGSSPARTVRLPAELSRRLDAYTSAEHTTPSEVMRRALDEYLGRIGA
ncbi:CopG family ribbon-helix-helix protein [Mycolicibacter icosiumassiliensis]|uniref:CopG family ribbon-helix-helix protein n=1 Tax=Mycolicibacter icosiumassiliensis TaxID=1792835 RepID=UPI00389A349C